MRCLVLVLSNGGGKGEAVQMGLSWEGRKVEGERGGREGERGKGRAGGRKGRAEGGEVGGKG